MSEHRPTDDPGGDDSGFVEDPDQEEHPLEGGQGEEVDEVQEESRAAEDDD